MFNFSSFLHLNSSFHWEVVDMIEYICDVGNRTIMLLYLNLFEGISALNQYPHQNYCELEIKTQGEPFFGGLSGSKNIYKVLSSTRFHIVGWICLVFSISVFATPLCILKHVIRTTSIEFMPFSLSLSLTLNAFMWFFYGLLIKDFNIAILNILGFIFGIIQMVLYVIYKNPKKVVAKDQKFSSNQIPNKVIALEKRMIDVVKLSSISCQEIDPVMPHLNGHKIAKELNIVKPSLEVTMSVSKRGSFKGLCGVKEYCKPTPYTLQSRNIDSHSILQARI
ncbi:hypothetical protein HYC85_025892 [Camellia sinensis]|uniref:Bidirectional sugar transporter SWEET n=1 Tax=Camellia sinensis TaxID=4442 RepID=A0A7J7G212_CAMSI|nr:hypothetical protein HYC85_025892 [Camellia sinensis]